MAESNVKNIAVKALFIIGIIVVIFILAFAVMQVIPRIFSSFSNVSDVVSSPFNSNGLSIEVDDDMLTSGRSALISWEYEARENGIYEFEYECTSDYLNVELGTSNGNRDINCDTIYHLAPTTQAVSILPVVNRDNVIVDLPINIRFIGTDGEIARKESVELSVKNQSADSLAGSGSIIDTAPVNSGNTNTNSNTNTNTSNQNNNTNPVVTTPTYSGYADLAIFAMTEIDDVTIAFTVSNLGTYPSGNWIFRYEMPDNDVEYSPLQPSLRPGDAVRYTLRFEDVPEGEVEITLDPYAGILETNERNNQASIDIDGDLDSRYDEDDEADLEIDDLEVGYIDGNDYEEDDRIDENDEAYIRFTVTNIGGEDTGRWRYEIENLPNGDDDYESSRQSSLEPGESRTITLEIDDLEEGDYRIKVTVDSRDDVDEEKESNNDESEELEVRD